MRRALSQATTNAARSLRGEASQSTRTPYVCASCLRRSATQQSTSQQQARRSFVTTPSRRQHSNPAAESGPPRREAIAPQTHYDFFPLTFPEGAPPASPFTPDLRQLRKEFLQLQSKSHPDLVPASQKRRAEAISSRINEAYKTIQDPLRRAVYLLNQRGIDVEDESAKLEDNALLMEVMEAREAVEEVSEEGQLQSIRDENNVRIEDSVQKLEKAFADGDLEFAAREAVRLRYWMNIEESIHGWEKGQGGGILHH